MGCYNSKISIDQNKKIKPPEIAVVVEERKSERNVSLRISADGETSIKTSTFKYVMADPMGRNYFMRFLELEHAEENLTFFQVTY